MSKTKPSNFSHRAPSVITSDRKYRAAYVMQKHNARRRGITFLLTFEEWLSIWKRSRKLNFRGRDAGCYVMARVGDQGPYKVGNVKIIRAEKNMLDGQANQVWTEERKRKISLSKLGKPRPDLANLNRSRVGKRLTKKHRQNIAAGLTGKTRGPYKTWKGVPR